MRILWDSNLYKSIILSHLNRWFCLAPGFPHRIHGPVVKLLPVVSEGPRIEDLILRSRISPMAIGGLEALLRLEVWRWCRKKPLLLIHWNGSYDCVYTYETPINSHLRNRWCFIDKNTCIIYICIYKNIPFFGWKILTYICWTPSDSCFCCVCWMLLCNFQTSCEKACQVWDVSHWFVIGWNMVMKWSTSCF